MDSNSIAALMMGWQGKIPDDSKLLIQEKLKEISEDKMPTLSAIQLKSPVIGLVCGLLGGGFGVDRFYKGNFLLGGIKLVLCLLYLICYAVVLGAAAGSDENPIGSLAVAGFFGSAGVFFSIVLAIWCFIDFFLVWKGIKKDNFNKIQNTLLVF